ncbi:hypothetical protein LZP73_14875 [Shewanella sp. AS16]|uniref:hypothetical protein n=1 Tax=Shewanella sp. AS16 TaxID=2907625 RepID=UPI001F24888D|nr:hypothetical protein [Shewanella sp. AS16]MCE9687470.1 hypothetical protein [Shewanella sp. AS16]
MLHMMNIKPFGRPFLGYHLVIYLLLFLCWLLLRLFSHHATDFGWGFIPFVISLPFVPFILVWLGVQFSRHFRYFKEGHHRGQHACHCACTMGLLLLYIFHFVY